MKTKNILLIVSLAFSAISCSQSKDTKDYLKTVLNNLEEIQSANYTTEKVAWSPYETEPRYTVNHYVKEFNNPADTTIGASFVQLFANDTTHLDYAYDGDVRVLVWDDSKTFGLDSFNVDRGLPFRIVGPPFYNYTKSIIRYILTNTDSVTLEQQENDSTFHLKLTIHEDRQIEFFGKAYKIPDPPMFGEDPTSHYEIWIDKKTNLPFKYLREMSTGKNQRTVFNPIFNKMKIENFRVSDYFPADYERIDYKEMWEKRKKQQPNELEGSVATDFSLTDTQGNNVSLKNIHSDIVLLQFTGIGCGHCKLSIPFLEKMLKEYPSQQLTVLSIETWGGKMETLKNYQAKHQFTYTFLQGNNEVTKAYNAAGVPKFFILDKNHVIRKVFSGYAENKTDSEIRSAVDDLLKE